MKIILNEIQEELLTIKNVIEKYYGIFPLKTYFEIELSDSYNIQIAIAFVPKKISPITPQIYTASSRYKLTEPDSSGERALFIISSQTFTTEETMPLLDYIGNDSRDLFRQFCNYLFNIESIKTSNEIDPETKYYLS